MKKLGSLLLAVALFFTLAACGGTDDSAPLITSIVPPTSAGSTAPAPEPEPEIELNQAFLTGLEKGPDYPEGKRICAVMLNNQPNARPQNGTSEAQMIVEITVEYGVTRLMAVYEDYEKIPRVGGIRSARDQYFQLLIPYRGFFMHEGPGHDSHPVNVMIRDNDYRDYDLYQNGSSHYLSKDASRSTQQYRWYDIDGAAIAKMIEDKNLDPNRTYNSTIFNFVPYTQPARVPEAAPMPELTVLHNSGYRTYFEYNEGEGRYFMSQFNSGGGGVHPTVDNNNGTQLSFENVVVLFAPMSTYPNTAPENLPKFDYSHGGAGYYFSQGHYEPIFWRKGAPADALQLERGDRSGEPVLINTGRTYLAVVNDELLPDFDEVMTTGKAAEAAQAGQVTSEAQLAD